MTTWNPSDKNADVTLSNGNLTATAATNSVHLVARGTTSKSTGKAFYEVTLVARDGPCSVGFANATASLSQSMGENSNSFGFAINDGQIAALSTASTHRRAAEQV